MNATSKCITFLALAAATAAANAQWYGEMGYSALKVRAQDAVTNIESSPNVYGLTLGYGVNNNLAIEGRTIFGLNDDAVKSNGALTTVRLQVDGSYGLFIKPRAMLGEGLEAFGYLGYMRTKLTFSGNGMASGRDEGLAYGLGASYGFTKSVYLTGNYMSLYDNDGVKIDGLTLGVGLKF